MRQFLTGWMAALSVAVGSLAMTGTSTGAVVSLNANSGLNTPIAGGSSEEVSFAPLPADLDTINGFTISFSYADGSTTTPSFGVGSLEVVLFQSLPIAPGASIFIAGGVYNISPSATATAASFTSNVGDSSATSIDTTASLFFTLDPLSAYGLWGLSAGSTISFFFVNATTSPTSVAPKILSATLLLDYNPAGGGGAVPEPSTLAIALVGLAGWRGRRMLRRC
ncbi:MAG: PEP-CTERM sorting domain-containing protein [Pirellulaceae bacterium]